MDTVGKRIKAARNRAGMKQMDLAAKMKKAVSTIRNWESDKTSVSEGYLALLSMTFNVHPDWLAHGKGSIEDPAFRILTDGESERQDQLEDIEISTPLNTNGPSITTDIEVEEGKQGFLGKVVIKPGTLEPDGKPQSGLYEWATEGSDEVEYYVKITLQMISKGRLGIVARGEEDGEREGGVQ